LLKSILEYIEDPETAPRNVVWLYVILLSFTDIIRSFADGQALWLGRKICIRLRAIVIGEIYAKALRRKAAAGNDTVLGDKKDKEDTAKPSKFKKLLGLRGKKKEDKKADLDSSSATEAVADPSKSVRSLPIYTSYLLLLQLSSWWQSTFSTKFLATAVYPD
jgi:hypothetical protein